MAVCFFISAIILGVWIKIVYPFIMAEKAILTLTRMLSWLIYRNIGPLQICMLFLIRFIIAVQVSNWRCCLHWKWTKHIRFIAKFVSYNKENGNLYLYLLSKIHAIFYEGNVLFEILYRSSTLCWPKAYQWYVFRWYLPK